MNPMRRRLDRLSAAADARTPPTQVAVRMPDESRAEANARLGLPADAPTIDVNVCDTSTPRDTTSRNDT